MLQVWSQSDTQLVKIGDAIMHIVHGRLIFDEIIHRGKWRSKVTIVRYVVPQNTFEFWKSCQKRKCKDPNVLWKDHIILSRLHPLNRRVWTFNKATGPTLCPINLLYCHRRISRSPQLITLQEVIRLSFRVEFP